MGDWPLHTIGDFVTANQISLQTGPFGAQLHAHDYLLTGVAVIPTEGIRDKKIDHSVPSRISRAKVMELSRHRYWKATFCSLGVGFKQPDGLQ